MAHVVSACAHVCVFQIIEALEQDEQAQKQKLAYKVEQIISVMSAESWDTHVHTYMDAYSA